MRFSIIVPAHNTRPYICACLAWVKKQIFKDYEVIVICDTCTDNTELVAKAYNPDILECVDYHMDGLARNRGLELAKGDYILFLDSDDYFVGKDALVRINDKLKAENNPDILCLPFTFNGIEYGRPRDNNGNYWTAVWTKCYKRSIIGNTRFLNKRHSDIEFTQEVTSKTKNIIEWVSEPLYHYNHMREGSITYEVYHHGRYEL